MCMYLCVCMFKCQDVDTHMCICRCGCWWTILSVIPRNILHLLWDSASPWHWAYQSGLAGHAETPTSLSLSASIGIANAHHHAGHVHMISRNQTHVLRFARQTLYWFNHQTIFSPLNSSYKIILPTCWSITYSPFLRDRYIFLLCWHFQVGHMT